MMPASWFSVSGPMVVGHQSSRQVRTRLVVFRNQLRFRRQPIPNIVAGL